MTTRKLITSVLSESELKKLRKKSFLERNKIIQEGIEKHQKERFKKIRMKEPKLTF